MLQTETKTRIKGNTVPINIIGARTVYKRDDDPTKCFVCNYYDSNGVRDIYDINDVSPRVCGDWCKSQPASYPSDDVVRFVKEREKIMNHPEDYSRFRLNSAGIFFAADEPDTSED